MTTGHLPATVPAVPSVEESRRYCRKLAKQTAGNFYYSFLTLPAPLLEDMCVLYACMRVSDDLGDAPEASTSQRRDDLARWTEQVRQTLAGEPVAHPVLPAVAEIVERHAIPHQYLFDVLDGIAMDLEPAGFETFEELSRYCYHVAGAVGLCCIHIWGFREEAAIERAIDCGLAFQLTNILRDLGEDAGLGRVYLPREDLRRFEYTADDLAAGVRDDRFTRLMEFQVSRAEDCYQRARELYPLLEPAGQPVLASMLRIYGGLLASIRSRDFDVFSQRISLPRWKKLWIAFDSVARHGWLGRRLLIPARDW